MIKTTRDTGELKAGQIVNITQGEYSDYGTIDIFVAIKSFNYVDKAEEFIKKHLEIAKKSVNITDSYDFNHDYFGFDNDIQQGFINYLISEELLALSNYREMHIGSYSWLGLWSVEDEDFE